MTTLARSVTGGVDTLGHRLTGQPAGELPLNVLDWLDVRASDRPGREAVTPPPRHDMKVKMEHRLLGIRPAGIQDIHPACPEDFSHGIRELPNERDCGIQAV